eukprot:983323-Amphidinium_carterae.1
MHTCDAPASVNARSGWFLFQSDTMPSSFTACSWWHMQSSQYVEPRRRKGIGKGYAYVYLASPSAIAQVLLNC